MSQTLIRILIPAGIGRKIIKLPPGFYVTNRRAFSASAGLKINRKRKLTTDSGASLVKLMGASNQAEMTTGVAGKG